MDRTQHEAALGDAARLRALAETGLLDTDPEPAFDQLAALAARLLGTPVALVSLITDERQFFKSCLGLPEGIRETPLSYSFCQYTVSAREPLVVEDAREHPVLKGNRAIEALGVVAYAGVPLVTRCGHVLGSFCAIDSEPRRWSEEDLELLEALAGSVVATIELRQEAEDHRRTAEHLREGRARVRMMMDQMPVLTWSTDQDLRLDGAEGLGINSEALRGRELGAYFSAEAGAAERVVDAHRRALEGESVRYEVEWTGRHFDSRVEPFRDEDGGIRGVIGVAYDVSEQREAQQELARSRRQFQALVEHGSDIVALVGPDGTIEYESPSVQRVLGYDPADVVGQPFHRFIHPEDLPETTRVFQSLLADPASTASWRVRVSTADGGWRDLEAVAKNAVGVPSLEGVVFTARDVTEEVAIQAQLDERKNQLVHSQKLDALGRLAAGVAHDFNNLLTVMTAHAEFLREMVYTDEAREEARGIVETSDRAAELTRQLLAFSGQQVTEPTRVRVDRLIDALTRMLRRLIGEDISLQVDTNGELPEVWIDPARLEQVIVNLGVNARDAMPEGGDLSIRVRGVDQPRERVTDTGTLPPGSYLLVEVTDTGVGMTEETRSRIFEPFYTTKGTGGTGLGLATSFGIVTDAGGGMEVRSEYGVGSTFQVYLPVAPAESVAEGARPEIESAAARNGSGRVLLVEDDPHLRQLTARMLDTSGYDVVAVGEAREAIQAASTAPAVDILVTDVILPDRSGPELYEELAREREGLPVLYVSGYSDRKLKPTGVLGERRRFLAKPFRSRDLVQAIKATLAGEPAEPTR